MRNDPFTKNTAKLYLRKSGAAAKSYYIGLGRCCKSHRDALYDLFADEAICCQKDLIKQ